MDLVVVSRESNNYTSYLYSNPTSQYRRCVVVHISNNSGWIEMLMIQVILLSCLKK